MTTNRKQVSSDLDAFVARLDAWLVFSQLSRPKAEGERLAHIKGTHVRYEPTTEPSEVIWLRELQVATHELSVALKERGL